jgi:hypothetical protein
VWLVEADGCGWNSKGSAFAIDDRHLVTNRHVVANDSTPELRSRGGRTIRGKVIGSTAHPDVAVIETDDRLDASLVLSKASADRSDPLVVLGYPSPKHFFSAASGRIVSFQGPGDDPDEAALTNVPIAKGNSGGPGLLGDASVAGIVTLMRLRTDEAERVAIMFTAEAIRPTVQRFLREPEKVLSTCGLGPDHVPRVPKSYEITAPPPTAEPVLIVPTTPKPSAKPAVRTARPAPTPRPTMPPPVTPAPEQTPRDCPSGTVDSRIEKVEAAERPEEPGTWTVRVYGSTTNNAGQDATLSGIYVRIDGDPPMALRVDRDDRLAPNQVIFWTSQDVVVRSDSQPSTAVAFASWDWSEPEYAGCGHD